tara:strand:- start:270 stop:602 length:333 start_codon:yes stop_codon:yes gene_type:complete
MSKKSKDSFVFYRSWYEAAKHQSDSDRLTYYELILEYALNQNDNSYGLSEYMSSFWILSKPNIDANLRKWKNGCKGGRPKTKKLPENNQRKPNVNDNEDVNDNVDDYVNE